VQRIYPVQCVMLVGSVLSQRVYRKQQTHSNQPWETQLENLKESEFLGSLGCKGESGSLAKSKSKFRSGVLAYRGAMSFQSHERS
jgi:hypothetical protein